MRAALFAAGITLAACAVARAQDDGTHDARGRLVRARDWLYQLQELDPDRVRASRFDVVVTDPSRDGSDDAWWPRETVDALRAGGRVALAYVSIGEAESYRGYWRETWTAQRSA